MKIYLIFAAILCIITFVLYGVDKKKAQDHQWRISERSLLLFGLLGGALGGLLGMKVFRHKTKHWYFWVVNVLGIVINVLVILMCMGVIQFTFMS